jgi:hypothetical protein
MASVVKKLLSATFLASMGILAASAVQADPIIIGAAVSAGASTYGAAMAAGSFAAIAGGAFTFFAKSFLVSATLGLALNALTPKPKSQGIAGAGISGYQVSGISSAADQAVIYGQTRIGGVIVYKETTDNNKYLHSVIALAGHEVQEISTIYLNDEALTLDGSGNATAPAKYVGYVRVIKHLGEADQVADATLISESNGKWTSDHRLRGIAYIYLRLQFNGDAFPNGEPQVTCLVKGKKIFNPNTSTTAWSSNAALCLRDYLVSNYGLNVASGDIDDTSFGTAINVCDESVTLAGGGSQSRYTCNGSFSLGQQPKDIIDGLLRSMGGILWYAQGKWRVKAAEYTTPAISFDENDLRSGLAIQTRHSRRDNFNIVRGKFRGAESNYQVSDFPEVKSSAFITVDGGEESAVDLDLTFTDTAAMAQRIAKIALYRNREQLTLSGSFGLKALQVQVGDIVSLTNTRMGFSSKPFEVSEWSFKPTDNGDLVVDMTLREISSAVFDWNAEETAFEQNNTVLPDPFDVPPVGISLSPTTRIINEDLTNVVTVDVTSDSPERVDLVEIQYKKTTDTNYISSGFGELGVFEIIDLEDANYDIRARAINTFGLKGDFTTRTDFAVQGLADPPANVTNFRFDVNSGGIVLEWDAVPDLDLSFYRLRYAQQESGATFANATTSVDKVARPANSVTVPARSGTYLIKAYDKSGNQSVAASTVVIRSEDLAVFSNNLTQAEATAFSGTKTGCSVVSNQLRITDPSSAPSTATYEFSNYIDTGAVRIVRATMNIEVVRINDAASVTFDTLTGNFDALAGNFDDLSGGSSFADTDVLMYIATTDDDPSGTPTWSDFKRFKAGDFSGRAFKFKVELNSDSDNVTPAVDTLTAKVSYN